jgi:nicotinate-nucleotide adenylyltransferase
MNNMRIGIFGGSFNPPHNGHLNIALGILKSDLVERVIFIPTIKNVCHDKKLVSKEDRYNMTKLLVEGYTDIEVSDLEIKNEVQNYTYQTLNELKLMYPNDEIILVIGTDSLKEIERWREYKYILKNYKIIVSKRDDDNIDQIINSIDSIKEFSDNIIHFDSRKFNNVSSTLIRNKLLNKENINELIPENVYNYIKEHNLYEL